MVEKIREFTAYSDSLVAVSFAEQVVAQAGEDASLSELLEVARRLVGQSTDRVSFAKKMEKSYREFVSKDAKPTEMLLGHQFRQWDRVFRAMKLENQVC